MPVMPLPLSIGDNVTIEFIARNSNSGTSVVTSGFTPDPPHVPAPVFPPVMLIARGASGVQHTTISRAFSLIINIDVPMAGVGDITVRVNGTIRDQGTITGDQEWIYVI
jgi:hypothetical protein